MASHLEEIVRVTCNHNGIHATAAQREIFDRVFADLTRARSKDAFTKVRVIKAVAEAVKLALPPRICA